jgi:hypothetical protein
VAAAHGLIKDLDAEVAVAVVLKDDEVPDVNGMRVGGAPTTIMEEYLPLAVEHHLRGPQAGRAARQAHEDMVGLLDDMVGLLPVDNRGEPLGHAQTVPAHALVDGHAKLEAGEVDGDRIGRRQWRWWLTLASPATSSSSASASPTATALRPS